MATKYSQSATHRTLIEKGYILAYNAEGHQVPVTVANAFPGKVLFSSPEHTVLLLFNQETDSFWVHREPNE